MFGVIAAVGGSILLAIGMAGQRFAHLRIERTNPGAPYLCNPLWLFFFGLFVMSNGGDAIALSFAPQSVVTPLGSMSLVSNALVARLLLKEKLDLCTVLGCVTVIAGVGLIVVPSLLGDQKCSKETIATLASHWGQTRFIVWAAAQLAVLVSTMALTNRIEQRLATRWASHIKDAASASRSSKWFAEEVKHGKCLVLCPPYGGHQSLELLTRKERLTLRTGYVLACGLLASWTVLFVKCAGEGFKSTARGGSNPWEDGRFYAMVVFLIVSVPLQLMYLNKALQRFEAQFVVPTLQGFWSLSSITMGALFFSEFDSYLPWHAGIFIAGVVITLIGMLLLARREEPPPDEDDEAPDDADSYACGMEVASAEVSGQLSSPDRSRRTSHFSNYNAFNVRHSVTAASKGWTVQESQVRMREGGTELTPAARWKMAKDMALGRKQVVNVAVAAQEAASEGAAATSSGEDRV